MTIGPYAALPNIQLFGLVYNRLCQDNQATWLTASSNIFEIIEQSRESDQEILL